MSKKALQRPTLSVIVPVYKAEATLFRAVASIVMQTYTDLQIVLVDDGSPDRCGEMCDEWAADDPRIVVVHQRNSGLSEARNTGLRCATGQYVTFVDADDAVDLNTYSEVMAQMKPEYDMMEFNLARVNAEGDIYDFTKLIDFKFTFPRNYWYGLQSYRHTYVCNKIFRRSLFDEVRFQPGMLYEDAWLMASLLPMCKCVGTTRKGAYYYHDNPAGITQSEGKDDMLTLLCAHLAGPYPVDDDEYYLYLLNLQIDVFRQNGIILLRRRRVDLSKLTDRKKRLKGRLSNLFGVHLTCLIFQLHHWYTTHRGRS